MVQAQQPTSSAEVGFDEKCVSVSLVVEVEANECCSV